MIYTQKDLVPDRLQKVSFVRPPSVRRGVSSYYHACLALGLTIHQSDAQDRFEPQVPQNRRRRGMQR